MGRNRPISMHRPRAVFHQVLVTVMPAKADPLLLLAEVKAYRTSERACAPVLSAVVWLRVANAAPVPISTRTGMVRK